MKIFVKTLKGDRFEIQVNLEDSVADVKKNIETVMGVTAAEQMLIHKGKVLEDETTMEANEVSEKSIIAVMKRKHASTVTSTSSASLKPQVQAAHPSSTASNMTYESISESGIQQILEMVSGTWSREAVAYALYFASNDLDKAVEYLYFGLPEQSEDPHKTEEHTQEPEASQDAIQEWSLDALRNTPEEILEVIEEHNPQLVQFILDNKADFLRLVLDQPQEHQDDDVLHFQSNEPNNGGESGNQVGKSEETEVEQPQADQTNKPNNGDGDNQVGGESEETEVETAKDTEAKTRVEAEIECLEKQFTRKFVTDGDSSKQYLAGFLELKSFLSPVKEKMKIFVKTLKGARFEIQVKPEDSVADVKKNIETVLGVNAYPAAEQRLIHKGKVLKDETTVEANNVSEKSTIGVMKYESISENNIQWILEMSGGEWERDLVEDALYLAYNDIDKAVEYIYFGLPVDSEYPSITEELLVQIEDLFITEGETHQEPDERPSAADLEQSLDFARYTQEYDREYLRALARSHPSIVKDFVEMVHEDNPLFFQFIRDNKADILRLLREGGTGGNQVGESKETEVEVVTPEDYELIERLEALGFERGDAAVAYFACNRNLQVAANHLLGYKHKHEPRRE
uniref:DNA repair protein RAD23 n=1 Tax=Brassica campestris TaxID=3711 RepID=M4CWQ1_BRACM